MYAMQQRSHLRLRTHHISLQCCTERLLQLCSRGNRLPAVARFTAIAGGLHQIKYECSKMVAEKCAQRHPIATTAVVTS